MPGPILHEGCRMECATCHSGIGVNGPQNQKLKVGPYRALVREDDFKLLVLPTCPGMQMKPPQPCDTVRWEDASVSPVLVVDDLHVLIHAPHGGIVGKGMQERGRVLVIYPDPIFRQL